MPDLLSTAVDWLHGQRHAHLTRSVTYVRGVNSVVLSATVGQTEFEQVDDVGLVQKFQARDYLIRTSDLVLAGSETLPAIGDRIVEVAGAKTYEYEVMAPGQEPPYRFNDPYRNTLRVHTKLIEVA